MCEHDCHVFCLEALNLDTFLTGICTQTQDSYTQIKCERAVTTHDKVCIQLQWYDPSCQRQQTLLALLSHTPGTTHDLSGNILPHATTA